MSEAIKGQEMRTFSSSIHGNISLDVCTDKKRLRGVYDGLFTFLKNCTMLKTYGIKHVKLVTLEKITPAKDLFN